MGTSPRPGEINSSSFILLTMTRIILIYHLYFLMFLGNCRSRESFKLEGKTAWGPGPADLWHSWRSLSPAQGNCLFCLCWNKPCNVLGWLLLLSSSKHSSPFQCFFNQPALPSFLLFFWLISVCPFFLPHDVFMRCLLPSSAVSAADPSPSGEVPVYF